MKKLCIIGIFAAAVSLFVACGGNDNTENASQTTEDTSSAVAPEETTVTENPTYDPHRGEGKFKEYEAAALNPDWAAKGQNIYNNKCQGCHKLTNEKLVGPGWKGVTDKHSAAWILNFITNPDAMLDQDPELQKQIDICMVRMPNQNLSDDEAKEIYDFMRQNDQRK